MKEDNLDDVFYSIRDSAILDEWGIYIRAEKKPGPGEKQDPVSGIWGTKPQALGRMVASQKDDDDLPHLTVENVDRCVMILDFVRMQHPKHIAILFGWFCEWPYHIEANMANVQVNPLSDSRQRYKDPERFAAVLNEAIGHVERSYRNMIEASIK